jgi:hypothetical protein
MPKAVLLVFPALLLAVGCSGPVALPGAGDDTPEGRLASMAWMAGSWIGKTEDELKRPEEEGVFLWETHYTSPAGGLLLGMTKRYRNGKSFFFEYETFSVEDGKLVVRPYLQGTASVAFPLKSLDREARRAVFEKPGHQPSTLDYWRINADTLVISVTSPPGAGETAPRGFRLVMKRPGS